MKDCLFYPSLFSFVPKKKFRCHRQAKRAEKMNLIVFFKGEYVSNMLSFAQLFSPYLPCQAIFIVWIGEKWIKLSNKSFPFSSLLTWVNRIKYVCDLTLFLNLRNLQVPAVLSSKPLVPLPPTPSRNASCGEVFCYFVFSFLT